MTAPDPHATNWDAATAASAPTADSTSRVAAPAYLSAGWWEQHWQEIDKRIYQGVEIWIGQWWKSQRAALIDAIGEVFGQHRATVREALTRLKERVVRLEAASNFEERFNRLAGEIKRGAEIPQGELLAKIEDLQRQLKELKTVVGLDARVRELAERVSELEKTNNLEVRFTKLANEVKRESELPQSALLTKIYDLQHQCDELKRVAAQPGPQGPPGKLPCAKEYVAECVHYAADVVRHDGGLWQALCDTVHAPPHDDWICLARGGRDGITPNIRGTFDVYSKYRKLDIVAMDGASFVAKHDNPGICPGDGWQLMSKQGRQGRKARAF